MKDFTSWFDVLAINRFDFLSIAHDPFSFLRYTALKEVDRGNGENALRMFVEGLQQRHNALDEFPEQVKSMMMDNGETIRELTKKLPAFTKEEAVPISKPILLISGANTSKALSTIIEMLSRTLPKNKLITVADSAHFPHFEKPKECNSKIMAFLSEQTT